MIEQGATYRVGLNGQSRYRSRYYLLASSSEVLAICYWPFFLPLYLRLSFILLAMAYGLYSLAHLRKAKTISFTLSEQGRFVQHTEPLRAGWLSRKSYRFFGGVVLCYQIDVTGKYARQLIFWDQVDNTAKRRISRVLSAVKFGT